MPRVQPGDLEQDALAVHVDPEVQKLAFLAGHGPIDAGILEIWGYASDGVLAVILATMPGVRQPAHRLSGDR